VPQLQQSQSLLVVVEVWEEEEWEVFLLEECHNSNPEEEELAPAEVQLPLPLAEAEEHPPWEALLPLEALLSLLLHLHEEEVPEFLPPPVVPLLWLHLPLEGLAMVQGPQSLLLPHLHLGALLLLGLPLEDPLLAQDLSHPAVEGLLLLLLVEDPLLLLLGALPRLVEVHLLKIVELYCLPFNKERH